MKQTISNNPADNIVQIETIVVKVGSRYQILRVSKINLERCRGSDISVSLEGILDDPTDDEKLSLGLKKL